MQSNHLSIKQETAIDLIMAGHTDSEVAQEHGISRQTISRWRNDNPKFIEALKARRTLLREQHMQALSDLIEKAIGVLSEALESDDQHTRLKTAIFTLKVSGLQGFSRSKKELNREENEKGAFLSALQQALTEKHQEKDQPS